MRFQHFCRLSRACSLSLLALLAACGDHRQADSDLSSAQVDQTTVVRSLFANAAAPTQDQLASLHSPESLSEFIHNDVPTERWHIFALIENNDNKQLAISSRISRLNVIEDSSDAAQSLWNFSDVMALESELVEFDQAKRYTRQQTERVALELAGADSRANKVWVGASVIEKSSVLDGAIKQDLPNSNCVARYSIDLPIFATPQAKINAEQLNCFESTTLRSAVQMTSNSMAVRLTGDNAGDMGNGRAWFTHAWGWPVNNDNAAVVFDRAWLILDNDYEIQLQQTKRRSGKGPSSTTGTMWSLNSTVPTLTDKDFSVQWSVNKTNATVQWRITAENPTIDIVVQQAVQSTLSSDERWFGPVKISGSHQGYGFLDYQP